MKTTFTITTTLAIILLAVFPGIIQGANTWDGEIDGRWANPTNWDDNAVPASGANVTFPDALHQEVDLGANRTVGNLTFHATNSYRLGTQQLTLNGVMTQYGGGSVTLDSDLFLGNSGGSRWIRGDGTGTVFLRGAIRGVPTLYFDCTNAVVVLGGTNAFSGNSQFVCGTLHVTGGGNTNVSEFRMMANGLPKILIHDTDSVYPMGTGQWVPADTNAFILRIPAGPTRRVDNTINNGTASNVSWTIEGEAPLMFTGNFLLTWNVSYPRFLTIANPRTIVTGPVYTQVPGPAATFYKKGAGVLELQHTNNTADIPFVVMEGSLVVNGIFSNSTKSVTVQSGAALGGTGILSRTVTIQSGGRLEPGEEGTGRLTVSNLTFQTGACYEWNLDRESDQVEVLKTLTLGTSATLRLRHGPRARCKPSDSFVLFTYTGAHPSNPAWQFEFEGDGWTHTNATVVLDTEHQRVVLTGIGVASRLGTVIAIQ